MSAAYQRHIEAREFFEKKLEDNPENARYNQFLGTLKNAERKYEDANRHFQRALNIQPNNVMFRNDYAMALSQQNRNRDGVAELQKTMILNEDIPFIRRNMAALYGRYGDFNSASTHAIRAVQLDPSSSQGHRNLAKIYDAQGDTFNALRHNKISISIEEQEIGQRKHTSAYRAAAVQIVSKGGDFSEAHKLMDAARRHEGKHTVLETTQKTWEIIGQVMKRRGNKLDEYAKEAADLAEKAKLMDGIRAGIMPTGLKKVEQKNSAVEDDGEGGAEGENTKKKK